MGVCLGSAANKVRADDDKQQNKQQQINNNYRGSHVDLGGREVVLDLGRQVAALPLELREAVGAHAPFFVCLVFGGMGRRRVSSPFLSAHKLAHHHHHHYTLNQSIHTHM